MTELMVINGRANLTVHFDSDEELVQLMSDAGGRIEAGEGFWVASAGDETTGAQALWVPPGSVVQFRFERSTVPLRVVK